jgi:cell division protein FtsB
MESMDKLRSTIEALEARIEDLEENAVRAVEAVGRSIEPVAKPELDTATGPAVIPLAKFAPED